MFDCHFLMRYDPKKRFTKKGKGWSSGLSLPWNLGIPLKRRHPLHSQRRGRCQKIKGSKMVSMLQTLQTENRMRRGAFTIVTECFGMACSMAHCLWNRVVCMHATGHIISPEFHSHKKIPGDGLCIHQSLSRRESRTSHYGSDRLKESW